MSVLRRILSVAHRDRRRNIDEKKELGIDRDVLMVQQQRRLTYFGHVVRMDPEMREPHGVSSPFDHGCKVCVTVCLKIMPSFSDITDVSTIGDSLKADSSGTPLYHVAQYGNNISDRN